EGELRKTQELPLYANPRQLRGLCWAPAAGPAISVALVSVTERDYGELVSLADYERAAEGMLAAATLAYVAGGAGDERTRRDNAAAWARLAIRPRVLVGVGTRDPSIEL